MAITFTSQELEFIRSKIVEAAITGAKEIEINGHRVQVLDPQKQLELLNTMSAMTSDASDGGIILCKFGN